MPKFSDFLWTFEIKWVYLQQIHNTLLTMITGEIINLIDDAPFCEYDWVETFGEKLVLERRYVDEIHKVVIAWMCY